MEASRRRFVKGLTGALAAAGTAGAGYAAAAKEKVESSGISEEVAKALEALQDQLNRLKSASEPLLDRVEALQAVTERLDRRQRLGHCRLRDFREGPKSLDRTRISFAGRPPW